MAQGKHNLGKARKSRGSQRRKVNKTAKLKRKGGSGNCSERSKDVVAVTKAINRKNERIIAGKALTISGNDTFRMSDLCSKGKKENERQLAKRSKKENAANTMGGRLQKQLCKLGQMKK
uniref:Uncharacterized protein n=1 Tax=Craspedostauros australis TaxID=1486917 RepID=A0A7R9ZNK4_9STRA|mmetsp:Transcript_23082/g.64406  ORF Transcript_23082/g.64406 Transcript_23082/m.64406 type:complete len:119 (+) Transcript_23082:192-548(+)|eukprot:CAMPEP_0198127852 /NCGR_PEP_ID=MMETSP1442-20131203/48135_1 /TAXON_ID= /ORGANISM="Craspedostauros australis, Strain CCMP3328" /LENGTH=118 /DNA_ID=CAMNT_0043787915 /DNA_START=172 /DNA_END=528 /DNA_ORIENTATION=+